MDYDLLYPGRFLKAVEFKGREVTLTIDKVRVEELEDQKGKRGKGIISFRETKKELVLNRTNGECLKGMFGRETDNWCGKRVTFWPAPFSDHLGLGVDVCIRVRGSPDLDAAKTITVQLPRKKPVKVTMQKTGKQSGKPAQPKTQAAPATPAEPPPSEDANPDYAEDDPLPDEAFPS